MNKWLRKTFGTNDGDLTTPSNPNHYHFTGVQCGVHGENFPVLLANTGIDNFHGIFSMVTENAWATGHADGLQSNGTCITNCHFSDAPIIYTDLWQLN